LNHTKLGWKRAIHQVRQVKELQHTFHYRFN
jgi:hypothetical protein